MPRLCALLAGVGSKSTSVARRRFFAILGVLEELYEPMQTRLPLHRIPVEQLVSLSWQYALLLTVTILRSACPCCDGDEVRRSQGSGNNNAYLPGQ